MGVIRGYFPLEIESQRCLELPELLRPCRVWIAFVLNVSKWNGAVDVQSRGWIVRHDVQVWNRMIKYICRVHANLDEIGRAHV